MDQSFTKFLIGAKDHLLVIQGFQKAEIWQSRKISDGNNKQDVLTLGGKRLGSSRNRSEGKEGEQKKSGNSP